RLAIRPPMRPTPMKAIGSRIVSLLRVGDRASPCAGRGNPAELLARRCSGAETSAIIAPMAEDLVLNVSRLRVLRELAHRGSITAVAEALSLTPSAVSQQLAALERETGVQLVERAGRGVRLTNA